MRPLLQPLLTTAILLMVACASRAQSVLEELEAELQKSSSTLRSSVVSIEWADSENKTQPLAVCGVVIDDQGSILTTGLPADAGKGRLRAVDSLGRDLRPRWLGYDPHTGLTLLAIQPGRLAPVPLAEKIPEVGAWTILIGNPDGMRHSIRYGNISGAGREVQIQGRVHSDMIEFTSSLRPGDSGALLANRRGEMVGIVRSGLTRADTTNDAGLRPTGIGFAIPASTARFVAEQLREHGEVQRGFLGIDADVPPEGLGQGAYVLKVYPGTPAEEAGLKPGDLIVALDDDPVVSFIDLARAIETSPPGSRITLRVRRADDDVQLAGVLGKKPAPPPIEGAALVPGPGLPTRRRVQRGILLGVEVQQLTADLSGALGLPETEGTIVTAVAPGTPAEKAGLKTLDVVTAVDNQPVRTPDELIDAIRRTGPGKAVEITVMRGDQRMNLTVTLAEWEEPEAVPWPRLDLPGALERERRLETLEQRVEALERRVAELEEALKAAEPKPAPKP